MRFDIDYTQAKTIATRLQDFLSENPKPKLSRSSSIEAVARMLGFNNRNEMRARLENEAPQHTAGDADLESRDPAALAKGIETALATYSALQRQDCAAQLVETARGISPEKPFWQAIHDDDDSEQIHALLIVEDDLIEKIRRDPSYRQLLLAILSSSEEYLGAYAESPDVDRALARALVNEALPLAETLWDVPPQEVSEDGDGYDAMNARRPWHGWDVDVSCWVPATRVIDLEFGESHTIETEILHLATIQVDAADEEHALARARVRLASEDFSMIWNARPDRGSRNLRGHDQDGHALTSDAVRDYAGWDDDWQYDLSRAHEFSADQIVF